MSPILSEGLESGSGLAGQRGLRVSHEVDEVDVTLLARCQPSEGPAGAGGSAARTTHIRAAGLSHDAPWRPRSPSTGTSP